MGNATVYAIKDFTTFVKADAVKAKSAKMPWVSMPIDFQSTGYIKLVDDFGAEAPAAYGVWAVTVQIAANMPERGVLRDSFGDAIAPRQVARRAQMLDASELFERVFAWAERVGWLEVMSTPEDVPEGSPECVPEDIPKTGQDGTGLIDGTGHDETYSSAKPDGPGAEPPDERAEQAANWCASEWNDRKPPHWPPARKPRKLRNLRARMSESGGGREFAAAYSDRLERLVAAFPTPMRDSPWTPSLRWLLEPNGWEKAAEKPLPAARGQPAMPGWLRNVWSNHDDARSGTDG